MTWRVAVAAAIGALGFIIARQGLIELSRANTTFDPVHLDRVTSLAMGGIYRYTRNPMYVGMFVMLLGWAVFLASPWMLLGPLLFAPFITRFQILPEERVLRAKAYRAQVRRWV